jgi:hypothetical protein
MSSPLVPSPFTYGDLPQGGVLAPIVITGRNPSNTVDKQYAAGYFWLSSLDQYTLNPQNQRVYGSGNLYYQAGNSSGTPNWTLVPNSGSSFSATSLTASAGNITATNGNLVLQTPGNKLQIAAGTNGSVGVSGNMVAGVVTIATTAVTASSIILYARHVGSGTQGEVEISGATAGTSFTLTSTSNTETSTFNYQIIN